MSTTGVNDNIGEQKSSDDTEPPGESESLPPSEEKPSDETKEIHSTNKVPEMSLDEVTVDFKNDSTSLPVQRSNKPESGPSTPRMKTRSQFFTGPSSPSADDIPEIQHIFSGLTYLGSSAVDAPMSASEANSKMSTFKEQYAQAIPVNLSIPQTNSGRVIMLDPVTDQSLAVYHVKTVLLCVRGQELDIINCFCFNVKNRKTSTFHCHVFMCNTEELCEQVFIAIGKAFRTKPSDLEILRDGFQLSYEIEVTVEIQEDTDGRGHFHSVALDKDCFRLKPNTAKRIVFSIGQSNVSRPLIIEKCFGLLIAPGQNPRPSDMLLLDMLSMGHSPDKVYSVVALWNPTQDILNDEMLKGKINLTLATDIVFQKIAEPVRFFREIKVQKYEELWSLSLRKKRYSTESFVFQVQKAPGSSKLNPQYRIGQMLSAKGGKDYHQPYSYRMESTDDGHAQQSENKKQPDGEGDSDQEFLDEEELLVSGWGGIDNEFSDDIVEEWRVLLEKWDGTDKTRSKTLRKLCHKGIPSLLRCQVWQMLSSAIHDPQLQESYRLLIAMDSPTEDVIEWDIKRTYVAHEFFQNDKGRDALQKISKAYSVYDSEVGYCQGLSFIVAVLLLQKMPEETAFSVLVKIMFEYKHRELFKSGFYSLHCSLFTLDKLIEEYMPDLHEHFQKNRVETHMYATQWFFTLFTAKFPLPLVFQFMDIYLCERSSAMFQAALALLKTARKELLGMDFENILKYFRVSLPRKFLTQDHCNAFFRRMSAFKIDDKKLKKFEKEYQAYLESKSQAADPMERLKEENSHLREGMNRLEHENEFLAQELVASKIHLREEMDRLEEKIDALSKESRKYQREVELSNSTITSLREDVEKVNELYRGSVQELTEQKKHHDVVVGEYRAAFKQLDEGNAREKDDLKRQLQEIKDSWYESKGIKPPTNISELEKRITDLELELAQTKLALVESACRAQDLEHKLNIQSQRSASQSKKGWKPFN